MASLAPVETLLGERESGQDFRSANVTAALSVANVLKSSLGPLGLDKLLVDDIGDVTVSNDGATILKLLEVEHPISQILIELSQLQDQEVGDGTTSVVLLAAELLKRGNQLVKYGIHPTAVISGYKIALKEALSYIKRYLTQSLNNLDKSILENVAKTTLSSKYIGIEAAHFASIVVKAVHGVKITTESGQTKYPVKAVNIVKSHGQSAKDSFLCQGYALARTTRASVAMPQCIKGAKIAIIDFNLRQFRMQLGVQIQITDPVELEKVREKERDITKAKIEKIIESGANVILSTQGIDDMSLKYFIEAKAIAVRRVDRQDARRIAKCTGATMCLTLSTLEGDEKFNPAWLGECDQVYESRVGDWDFMFFEGCRSSKAMTILLRGANESFLDEMERSIHDALCAVSRTCEHGTFCAGGGALETALAVYLEDFARSLGSREQLAVAEFAESLYVIPKTLAVNSALDSLELLGKLKQTHHSYQLNPEKNSQLLWYGLDLLNGKLRNNLEAGVIEPAVSKIKAIRFATEAAVTLLRIDDGIKPHIMETSDQPES